MSAPVTSASSASPASSALAGNTAAAGSSVSLTPLGGSLFSSMLSSGLSAFTMSPTTPAQVQDVATSAANTDAKSTLGNANFGMQQALLISADELGAMSQEDLKSLLASFSDTSDELSPKILVTLAPGVPAQETFENIKSHFAELGMDTSKFTSIAITNAATPATQTLPTDAIIPDATDGTLTVETADAAQAANFLLITTGFTPSEMGPIKDAIKSIATNSTGESKSDDSEATLTDNSDEVNASAAMVMMLFVNPQPKAIEAPAAQDLSFDLSSLSAFTQTQGSDMAEPDWTKKLSDKLSGMSLSDDSSPFDAEMNDILSVATPKSDVGFQGSISATGGIKKEAGKATTKDVSGEISPQATVTNPLTHLSASTLQNLNSDGLLMVNGNMVTAQNIPSSMTNPLFTSASAIGTHPSVQAVALVLIEKATSGSEKAKQELSVQLDPPELGRMQIQLSMEKDGVMKVHLLAEKQETLSLFQRDAHALKSALDSAGIQIDSSAITFDMAGGGNQSFNQLMGGSQQNNQFGGNASRSTIGISGSGMDVAGTNTIETKMDFMADNVTGNVHYSFWA
jgi:flagellar hook-length control protein FliK